MHRTAADHEVDPGARRHRGQTVVLYMEMLLATVLVTNLGVIGTRAEGPPVPWPSWVLEDRLARADVVALARWDDASGAAIYEMPEVRRVYIRHDLHVSRVIVGKLPQHARMLVRGGACFDRKMKRYFLDEAEAVYLPPNTGYFIVLLKRLAGDDYELVDGLGGFLSRQVDGTGNETTFITTRRTHLLSSDSIVPAKTPSPDIVAARVSLEQLGTILEQLETEVPRDPHPDASSSCRVRNADAVDRKTIIDSLATTADRLIAARTGDAFFRQHLVREENPQWIPPPIGGPHVRQPSEEWRGIGVAYRLRAFGKTFEPAALSVLIGPDRSIVGADRAPDCKRDRDACEFKVDEAAAMRIARGQGLAEEGFPWRANLHWEPSCGAYVWAIANYPSEGESSVILVTSGSGKVCGRQSVTTISCGSRLYQKAPPLTVAPTQLPEGR